MASPESQLVKQRLREQTMAQAGYEPTIEEFRQGLEAMSMVTAVEFDPEVRVEKLKVGEMPAEWVIAPNSVEDRAFLYLHGGGYVMGSCNTHRDLAARLSRSTGTKVLLVEYRLAPENPYPAAVEDALAAYRWLLASGVAPEHIVVGGDSAGGGLTVALLLSLKDAKEPQPAAAVLLSPWTDMEGTGESMQTRAEVDPWLTPEGIRVMPLVYIRDLNPRHPLVSPIYADLTGLPPLLVHVGNDECLLDDSTRLVEKARSAGVEVTFKIWEGMWHVFQSFAALVPEGKQAIEEIGEFVKGKLK